MAQFKSQEEFDAWKAGVEKERAKFDADMYGLNASELQAARDINNYSVGDQLMITFRHGNGDKTYKVEVNNVNYNNNGLVTIWGNELGSTAFNPEFVGIKQRYQHIISVKKVGHMSHNWRPPWSGLSHREAMRQYGVG